MLGRLTIFSAKACVSMPSMAKTNSGRFKKGNVSWHEGKTKVDYPQLSNAGRKPGFTPSNKLDLDEGYIVTEYKKGRTAKDIAKEVGCSRPTIIKRLHKHGVEIVKDPPRERTLWTVSRVAELREMYPTTPTRDVAHHFRTTKTNIARQAINFGIVKKIKSDRRRTKDEKKCCSCGEWFVFSEFAVRSNGFPKSECRKCERDSNKEYRKRYPDRVRATAIVCDKRRKLAKLDTDLSTKYLVGLKRLFMRYGRCPICGELVDGIARKWWIEHSEPIAKGGRHMKDNVFYDCNKCNMSKNSKTLEEYCGMTIDQIFKRVGIPA